MNLKKIVKKLLLNIGLDISIVRRGHEESAVLGNVCTFMDSPTVERKFIATTQLFDRLSSRSLADFADLVAGNPDIKSLVSGVPEEHYRREVLRLGNHYLRETFNKETGLSLFRPPQNVHAMVRQDIYCGDLYYCDLITEVLDDAGRTIKESDRILDFGCSSGRIIKTLQAVYPDACFTGCDPNGEAIKWAASEMPSAEFFISPEKPPIPTESGSYDIVYAISIWSHFSRGAAMQWLDEMHRILKNDGLLLITAHGFGALRHYLDHHAMSAGQVNTVRAQMQSSGFYFIDVFGPDGDWGVGKTDWGQSFFNPVYLMSQLTDSWDLVLYRKRRSENNQDVYLFRKK